MQGRGSLRGPICEEGLRPILCTLPLMQALRPAPGGILQGQVAPAPTDAGAPREHGLAMLGAPGDFRFTTKVTKGVPGALPLDPVGGHYHPPAARRAAPPERVCGTSLDGFATLRWCGQLAFLSPEAPSGEHPLLSNRGAGITGAECVGCVGFVSSLCQGIWLN